MGNDADSRMQHECDDLTNKANNISNFINSDAEYEQLPEKDKKLIREQLFHMAHYLRVLENRILRRHTANMT